MKDLSTAIAAIHSFMFAPNGLAGSSPSGDGIARSPSTDGNGSYSSKKIGDCSGLDDGSNVIAHVDGSKIDDASLGVDQKTVFDASTGSGTSPSSLSGVHKTT